VITDVDLVMLGLLVDITGLLKSAFFSSVFTILISGYFPFPHTVPLKSSRAKDQIMAPP
jgi:hypothetical protein